MSEMRARLRPGQREEAQMLAEMNLPMMRVEAQAAALAARQQLKEAKCARETALREAAAARRDAQRVRQEARQMRHDVVLNVRGNSAQPILLKLDAVPQISERIQINTNGMQQRIVVRKVQFTADQLQSIDNAVAVATANLDRVDFAPAILGDGSKSLKCATSRTWTRQMQLHYGNAMRHAMQSIHSSFNVTNVHQGTGSSL